MFSCLLVHVHTARAADGVSLDLDKVFAIEDALQKGVEAKSKILKTYRKPDRTQGILDQLLKTAKAVTTAIRSSNGTRTNITTEHSSHLSSVGIGLANSHMNLNAHSGSLPQYERDASYTHSWPVLNDDTIQYSAGRVDNGNLQNLLLGSWGIASGWNDIDLGFEDIVTF